MVRRAQPSDVPRIKEIVDEEEKMDADEATFTEDYFNRMLREQLVFVDENQDEDIVGLCFGKYNEDEGWCDFLGLVVVEGYRGEGRGSSLVESFEDALPEGVETIDLFATPDETTFFEDLGYDQGRTYIAYRKHV